MSGLRQSTGVETAGCEWRYLLLVMQAGNDDDDLAVWRLPYTGYGSLIVSSKPEAWDTAAGRL